MSIKNGSKRVKMGRAANPLSGHTFSPFFINNSITTDEGGMMSAYIK